MPHFQNQHEDNSPKTVVLSDEQFAKIVELLTPGFEMAKMYLAEMGERHKPDEPEHEEPETTRFDFDP